MGQPPFGIDYAWGRPSESSLKSNHVQFAMRYLSHDDSKNLTLGEAEWLAKLGIWCGVVWETTANRMLSGYNGGVADAEEAARQANACGMPSDRPIYFACDWDASTSQQDEIDAYLKGCASVIGLNRVGMYAGYHPLSRSFNNGTITYGWQTYAWSGGNVSSRAHIYQYSNGHNMGGCDVDYNYAYAEDIGQWKPGESPGTMALSTDDVKKILRTDNIIPATNTDYDNPTGDNPYWSWQFHVYDVGQRARVIEDAVKAINAVPLTDAQIDAIAQKVAEKVTPGLAEMLADELAQRLAE